MEDRQSFFTVEIHTPEILSNLFTLVFTLSSVFGVND